MAGEKEPDTPEMTITKAERWSRDIIAVMRCDDTTVTLLQMFVDAERNRRAYSHWSDGPEFPFAELRAIDARVAEALSAFTLWHHVDIGVLEDQLVQYEKWQAEDRAKKKMKAEEDADRKKLEARNAREAANFIAFMASFIKVFLGWMVVALAHYRARGSTFYIPEYIAGVIIATLITTASWLITPTWVTE